ncbi:hypothetical protein [Corynebacterium dentalis]|uniref:hypothetical protein n=1 Tax=Corynebacterium dentalis TaxID=2014528 RepID=UPI000C075855|nr:hypothetical protein [Corynebacterium dentalis]
MTRKKTPLLIAASVASLLSSAIAFAAPAMADEEVVVQPGTETPAPETPSTDTGAAQPGTETPSEPVEGTQPGTETPVEEAPTPVDETPQLGTETPVEEAPAPVEETTPPVIEAPVEEIPEPVDTTAPVEEAPVVEQPAVDEAPAPETVDPAAEAPAAPAAEEPVAETTPAPVVPAPVVPAKPVVLSEGAAELTGPGVDATAGYVTVPFKTTVNADVNTQFGEFSAPEITVGTYDLETGTADFSVAGNEQTLTLAKPVADGLRAASEAVPAEVTENARQATASGDYHGTVGPWDGSAIWGAESLQK